MFEISHMSRCLTLVYGWAHLGSMNTFGLWFGTFEPRHKISNNVVSATSKGSDKPAHMRSLIRAFASRLNISMNIKLLTEHHLEFLSFKGGYTGSSESTLVKISHCWKSYATAHYLFHYSNLI